MSRTDARVMWRDVDRLLAEADRPAERKRLLRLKAELEQFEATGAWAPAGADAWSRFATGRD
jgi:hypothetical protein